MKRSILFSLLVIGAVVALVAGAGTFAPFTTSDDDAGEVTATTLSITVAGTGTLDFSTGDAGCPTDLLPGDTCEDTVTVTNFSGVEVEITDVSIVESDPLEDCALGNSLSTVTDPADPTGTILDASGGPNDSTQFDIEVTFSPTGTQAQIDDCQGDTGTVEVTVTATNT